MILCAASIYEKKYYLDPEFDGLPQQVKDELQAACVLFVEEVSGIIILQFDDNGHLFISTQAKEADGFYDEIGAGLKIKRMQRDKTELFEQLELYYKVFIKGDAKADIKDLHFIDEEFDEDPENLDLIEEEEYEEELDELLEELGMEENLLDDEDDSGEEY